MSLESYLVKGYRAGQEIRWEFPREREQELYCTLKELGYRKYLDFVRQHQKDILKYISLSRSQRAQKKWVNHPDILLILCAAIQLSCVTDKFLRDIHPIADIVDRGSYREFHSVISDGLLPVFLESPFASFPFDGFDDPFALSES